MTNCIYFTNNCNFKNSEIVYFDSSTLIRRALGPRGRRCGSGVRGIHHYADGGHTPFFSPRPEDGRHRGSSPVSVREGFTCARRSSRVPRCESLHARC